MSDLCGGGRGKSLLGGRWLCTQGYEGDIEEYFSRMRQLGEPGDDLALQALSDVIGRTVHMCTHKSTLLPPNGSENSTLLSQNRYVGVLRLALCV